MNWKRKLSRFFFNICIIRKSSEFSFFVLLMKFYFLIHENYYPAFYFNCFMLKILNSKYLRILLIICHLTGIKFYFLHFRVFHTFFFFKITNILINKKERIGKTVFRKLEKLVNFNRSGGSINLEKWFLLRRSSPQVTKKFGEIYKC